jgi:hypothetical protein
MKKILTGILLSALSLSAFTGVRPAYADETAAVQTEQAVAKTPTEKVTLNASITNKSSVRVTGSLSGTPSGEDSKLYLFELQPYEDSVEGRKDPFASVKENGTIDFTLPLNEGTSDTKLYSKFVAAVWLDGKYQAVSNSAYINNPETVAKSTLAYRDPLTKKGLLIQLNMLEDAFELGVKHVNVNFNFAMITNGSGIDYTYEGKTYHFDSAQMADYDNTISALSGKGMVVTAIVLNGWNQATPELIYPGVKQSSSAYYYSFNTSTQAGYETTRALASFLAERYSGEHSNYGRVSNWVIGNEINDNMIWNYMGEMPIEKYIGEYSRTFRVFYNAIKSTSANARLFFSLDNNWNDPAADGRLVYSGKNVLDEFNDDIRNGGNISWGLAFHPYPIPMTEPEFWDDSTTGQLTQSVSTPVINFANLHVLTDYLSGDVLKDPSGNVRHVILSEEGFTAISATRGDVEQIQAAAFAYAYYIADSNPYVDAFILSRQVDAPVEVNTSCAFGLWSCNMNVGDDIQAAKRRKLWIVFKAIDKKNDSLEASEFAKSIIGINKWSDVIPDFRWAGLEK